MKEIGYNISDKRVAIRKFTYLILLWIYVILLSDKDGVPLPLKVEH